MNVINIILLLIVKGVLGVDHDKNVQRNLTSRTGKCKRPWSIYAVL